MSNTSSISKSKITSLAIGGFDGIHKAHQELIKRLDKNGALMIVSKYGSNLTPKEYRCRFVGLECFFYDLGKIKEFDCKEFADFLKEEFPLLKKIVVGYDFRYGKDRSCSPKDLEKYFKVEVVKEYKLEGVSVHSGVIRELLKNGDIKKANKLLGRFYSIEGKVVCGQGIGGKELVPTLNVVVKDFLLPKEGVYATKTKIDEKLYNSVTFIGIRETTDGEFSVETHILDGHIECKSEILEILFVDRIRDNKRFGSLEELKEAIKNDIKRAKEILDEYKA